MSDSGHLTSPNHFHHDLSLKTKWKKTQTNNLILSCYFQLATSESKETGAFLSTPDLPWDCEKLTFPIILFL